MTLLFALLGMNSAWSAPAVPTCKDTSQDLLPIADSGPWWFIPAGPPVPVSVAETQRLRKKFQGLRVRVYYGSWCSDSRKHIPEFLSLLKQLEIEMPLEWIPLDRAKSYSGACPKFS